LFFLIAHDIILIYSTGGGSGSCLQTTEAGGMGEGWSDVMAFWTEQTSSTVADYVMGQYVTK
jgi:extracellular elastinolytic metalloproteinase